jgi:hypothetical protein
MPHKFRPGDLVTIRGGIYSLRSPNHQYEIRQRLPADALFGEPPKYRAVNMTDGHERVLSEAQIEHRDAPTGEHPPAAPTRSATLLRCVPTRTQQPPAPRTATGA